MIKFREQVPSVYINASRDFQYLSWLIDIVLNSVKHNVDDIYNLPDTKADPKLTELLAMTLGFKVKRNYDQKQLAALVAVLPRILKYKGTKLAIDTAGKALLAAAGVTGNFSSVAVSGNKLEVTLPKDIVDASLFTDLLPYILPAGMTYRIINDNNLSVARKTELGYQEYMLANWVPDLDFDQETQSYVGLSNMFNVPADNVTFANFKSNNTDLVNIGLLDNSIIPAIDPPMADPELSYLTEQNEQGHSTDVTDDKK